jgi:hypothetical protein
MIDRRKHLHSMPDHARVWIYQSPRPLNDDEVALVQLLMDDFMSDWTSHGARMEAGVSVEHNRFIIIAADEQKAAVSGCGIDKIARAVHEIGKRIGTDFLDRLTIYYLGDEGIQSAQMSAFWALRKAEKVTSNTLVFNNLVRTVGEWKAAWITPFSASWHQQAWGG